MTTKKRKTGAKKTKLTKQLSSCEFERQYFGMSPAFTLGFGALFAVLWLLLLWCVSGS